MPEEVSTANEQNSENFLQQNAEAREIPIVEEKSGSKASEVEAAGSFLGEEKVEQPKEEPEVEKSQDEASQQKEPELKSQEEPKEEVLDAAQEVAAIKAEMEDLRLRQAAEMENFKKRLQREQQEQMQYASEKVLGDLLPTLDNLEYALQYSNVAEACKDMLQGVAMTHKLLLDAVQKHGLVPVGEVGEQFDPQIHEAVGFDPQSELEKGSVAKVLQRGYKLGQRLLRPARVMIVQ
ncbi:MAG: nucleotide exchange factor GrpE [Desulfovibrio sp.]|nr:nucleotide exchange factor GrpE [Desulfovibrio sp.]